MSLSDRDVRLGATDVQLLATVGAFRVVDARDLLAVSDQAGAAERSLRYLREQNLLTRETLLDGGDARHLLALTADGKAALELHRCPDVDDRQVFYAGAVKPRDFAHDSQLFQMFALERQRLEAEGADVVQVRLDYELKQQYQTALHDASSHAAFEARQAAFAATHDFTIVDGHLQLPDLRIEYETPDGRHAHRDLELVTAHYSRSQVGRKTTAGFTCYRAAGASARQGGIPHGSHLLERLT